MNDPYIDGKFEEIVNHFDQDTGFDVGPQKGPFHRVIVVLGVALAIVAVLLAAVVATPVPQSVNPIPSTANTAP